LKHGEFEMGKTFRCGDGLWRVTDIGTRVIVAIRIDETLAIQLDPQWRAVVFGQREAEEGGWLSGPPYPVAEDVFDEEDQKGCTPGEEK
jgi:hypothetical protein